MKKKLFVGVGILVVLVPLVAFLVLQSVLPPEKLLALVRPRLEAALGREVEIGGAGLSLLPLAANVENVRVRANPGFEAPYLLELGSLRLKLRLAPLLRRELDLRSLELTGLRLYLEQDDKESWNFAPPARPGSSGAAPARPSGTPLGLRVRSLRLVDSRLFLRSAPRQLELQAPLAAEIGLDVDRERRNVRVHGWLECAGLVAGGSLQKLPALPLRLEPEVQADLSAKTARIEVLRVVLQGFMVELEGRTAWGEGRPEIQLATRTNEFELAEILKLLPQDLAPGLSGVEASGKGRLDLRLHVPPGGAPDVRGSLTLTNGRVLAKGWPAPIEDLQVRLLLAADSLRVERFEARLAEVPLRLDGLVHGLLDPSRTAYDLGLRTRLDLATAARLAGPFLKEPLPFRIEGGLQADVRARGAVASKTLPELRGPIVLDAVRIETRKLRQPLRLQATLRADGSSLQIEKATLACGEAELAATGRLQPSHSPALPRLVLRAQTQKLDLDALLPEKTVAAAASASAGKNPAATLVPELPRLHVELHLDADWLRVQQMTLRGATLDLLSDGKTYGVQLRARELERETLSLVECQGNLEGTPAAASGRLEARRGKLGKVQTTQLTSPLRLSGTQVELHDVHARTYDGDLKGRFAVDLADPAAPRQELDIRLQEVQLSGVLDDLFGAGALVVGSISGDSDWSTAGAGPEAIRKQLRGKGQGIAVNGRFRDLPLLNQLGGALGLPRLANLSFNELGFSFQVEAGRVQLPEMRLRGNDANANVLGSIGLDGGLDLAVQLQLSQALTQQALKNRAQSALGQLFTDGEGRLAFDFDVQGSLRAPKVRVDLQATAARTGLKALGEQELRRLLGNVAKQPDQALENVGGSVKGALRDLLRPKPAPSDTTAKP